MESADIIKQIKKESDICKCVLIAKLEDEEFQTMEHNFFCSFIHNDLSILENEKLMKTIYTQTNKDIIKSLKNNQMIDCFVNDDDDFITTDESMI